MTPGKLRKFFEQKIAKAAKTGGGEWLALLQVGVNVARSPKMDDVAEPATVTALTGYQSVCLSASPADPAAYT